MIDVAIAYVVNFMCCKLHMFQIAPFPNCTCSKLHLFQVACIAHSKCKVKEISETLI